MIQTLIPFLGVALDVLRNKRGQIAEQTGVSAEAIDKVAIAFENQLNKDEKLAHMAAKHMEDARKHATATLVTDIWLVNLMRGLVRPITTFTALGWYVYARVQGIELLPEDYALIGGILAFWFGFRPFEKRQK